MRTLLIALLVSTQLLLIGQEETTTQSSSDKATVYFVRTSSLGAAMIFRYFVDDKIVGKSAYGKYIVAEVAPGDHIIWAKAENRSTIRAKLEAGKTYIINAMPQMGALSAGIKLVPINHHTSPKKLMKVKKYLKNKKQKVFSPEKLADLQLRNDPLIKKTFKDLENDKVVGKSNAILDTPIEI